MSALDYKAIGLRFKKIRELTSEGTVSQEKFGQFFSLSQSYVNKIEKGGKPSLEYILSVSARYGISLNWLLRGIPPIRLEGVCAQSDGMTTAMQEWLQLYRDAPHLLPMVKAFLEHDPARRKKSRVKEPAPASPAADP